MVTCAWAPIKRCTFNWPPLHLRHWAVTNDRQTQWTRPLAIPSKIKKKQQTNQGKQVPISKQRETHGSVAMRVTIYAHKGGDMRVIRFHSFHIPGGKHLKSHKLYNM